MRNRIYLLTPILGFCSFVLLYIIAAALYPGGSDADPQSGGFSVLHNYWCELLSPQAANGAANPGWRVAMTAMILLCLSLAVFWWQVPILFGSCLAHKICIRGAGVISMAITPFLSSRHHDLVITLASIPGIDALMTTFLAFYKDRRYRLVILGAGCLGMIGVNNYVYYTGYGLYALPVLQKATFLLVMIWMSWVTWLVYRHARKR
ncbi:hypothetical protein [Paraflavitalea pollutisoli]|uniref:hypothetical protein n=1 Tax=Paraflavitalea pollutisoli TaxID=3034143 RepID=UPI0023EB88B3|nr:hypothetical protein [Paraflavitalea sp. H1-2-19X]